MPALEKPDSPITTTVKWRFPSVHPEGRKYAVGAGAVTLFAFLLGWDLLAWLLLGLTLWVAAFFRDPVRTTPKGENLIIAPADGLITMIANVPPPAELKGPDGLADGEYARVSIFMSVFDVHINRAPISGRVKRIVEVGLPRPRDSAIVSSPQFGRLVAEVWSDLREEASRGMHDIESNRKEEVS